MGTYRTTTKVGVFLTALLLCGVTVAVTQSTTTNVTRVPVCVKDNGQLRVLTANTSTCDPPEQLTSWVVGGEVTDLKFGQGLIGTRDDGRIQLAIDPELVESCRSCNSGKVYAGFNDGPGSTPIGPPPNHGENPPTIATLRVPAGKYLVQAKLWVQNTNDSIHILFCKLSEAGAPDFDWVEAIIRDRDRVPISLTMVHEVAGTGQLIVGCSVTNTNAGQGTLWKDLKITALEVSNISNVFIE